MKIQIKRLNNISIFEVKKTNLLQALIEIKNYQDNSLTFRCGCKSGVCGSCAVRVNGTEKLACKTKIEENDFIEAIKNLPIIKDLVVDVSHETLLIKKTNLDIEEKSNELISQEEFEKVRNKIENDLVSSNSSIAGVAENLADNHVYYGSASRANTQLEGYMKVTREDILRVAKKYLTQDARVILHYLPKETK